VHRESYGGEVQVKPGVRRGVAVTSVLAALAVVIPQITGSLNLTTQGKVLSILAVGLLTACGQRFAKCVRDRQADKDALRVWPPEPLARASLDSLGVFPAWGPAGEATKYQPRPRGEDQALAEALRSSKPVIVHGPPGCGKTRATSEAARQTLGDVPAVIPVDSQSLRLMLEDGVHLDLSKHGLCLWLDGLDRFMDVLGPCSLPAFEAASKGVTRVVATIRTEQWKELVEGSGHASEAARALAQDAHVVELGEFSPDTPGEPIDPGARGTLEKPRSLWRDPVLGGLSAALVLSLVALAALQIGGDLRAPPSIGDQMDAIKNKLLAGAGPGRGHVVVDERVQFHTTDQPSWLLVVEDLPNHDKFYAGAANGATPAPRSDDLRIYDVVNGRLQLKLQFRPQGKGERAAEWRTFDAGATPSADYDEDGSPEVIAGYALPSRAYEALLPFGIDWTDGHYKLTPLTATKPHLATRGLDARTRTFRREVYETTITLRASTGATGLNLTGYRVQAFALAQKPSPRLLTAYFSAYPEGERTQTLEIHANQLRAGELHLNPCTPSYPACPAPIREQDVLVPPDMSLDNGLLRAWGLVGSRWNTPVRVVQHQR
jgi:hypothetical protein